MQKVSLYKLRDGSYPILQTLGNFLPFSSIFYTKSGDLGRTPSDFGWKRHHFHLLLQVHPPLLKAWSLLGRDCAKPSQAKRGFLLKEASKEASINIACECVSIIDVNGDFIDFGFIFPLI